MFKLLAKPKQILRTTKTTQETLLFSQLRVTGSQQGGYGAHLPCTGDKAALGNVSF